MVRTGSLRLLHKPAFAARASGGGGSPQAGKRRRRPPLVVLGLATDTLFTTVKCALTTTGKLSCIGGMPSLVARGIMVLGGSRVVEPSAHAAASGRGFDIHLEAGDVLTVLPELCDAEAAAFAADVFTLSGGGDRCRAVIMSGQLRKLRPGKSRRSSISKVVRSVVHGGARARYQDRLCSLIEDKLTTALYLHYTDRDDKPPIDLRYVDVIEPSANPELHGRGMDIRTLRGGELEEDKVFTFDEFDDDEASEAIFQAVLDFVEPRMQERAEARAADEALYSLKLGDAAGGVGRTGSFGYGGEAEAEAEGAASAQSECREGRAKVKGSERTEMSESSESSESSEGKAEAEAKRGATEAETKGACFVEGKDAAEEEVDVVEQPAGRDQWARAEARSTTCAARKRALCANARGRSCPGVGGVLQWASRNC